MKGWIDKLNSIHEADRMKAARVLGDVGARAEEAVPALQNLACRDASQWVRLEAYRALRAIDPQTTDGIPVPILRPEVPD
ncbi:MAG: hypothetical protein FJ303_04395 [Planctomycetes bacterium]|nr:hypothetical protein [Planctomycetota bacterium]